MAKLVEQVALDKNVFDLSGRNQALQRDAVDLFGDYPEDPCRLAATMLSSTANLSGLLRASPTVSVSAIKTEHGTTGHPFSIFFNDLTLELGRVLPSHKVVMI